MWCGSSLPAWPIHRCGRAHILAPIIIKLPICGDRTLQTHIANDIKLYFWY